MSPDQFHSTGQHSFGTLCVLTHHEHRFRQARSFLLHSSGVGEDECLQG